MSYKYWLVRYVPDAIRGEFVNIALIVGSESGDWAFRRVESLSRANRLGGSPGAAEDWLRRLHHKFARGDFRLFELENRADFRRPPTDGWVEELRVRMNNTVQISPPTPVRGENADRIADALFRVLVVDPPVRVSPGDKKPIVQRLADAFVTYGNLSTENLKRNVQLVSGLQKANFDFAVDRQDHIVQMTQVWSFQRRSVPELSRDIQAWSFAIDQLRKRGGRLRNAKTGKDLAVQLDRTVPVRVLYAPPRNEAQSEALAIARDAWESAEIVPFEQGSERALVREVVSA
ncbi:hypothetical protein [Rhodococcus koreensis]